MLVEAKKFSNISFDSISKKGRPDLLFNDNTQSMKRIFIFPNEEDEVFRNASPPCSHHPSEILRIVDPLLLCKPKRPFHLNG